MPITFNLVPHSTKTGTTIVEVRKDGDVCAVIYPDEHLPGIKIVSAHFAGEFASGKAFPEGVQMDNGENSPLPIPAVQISFDLRQYTIAPDGTFVRFSK